MRRFLRFLFAHQNVSQLNLEQINGIRARANQLTDVELQALGRASQDRLETLAVAAVAASRILGLDMFDVQLHGALALTEGRIAEMLTGEGKTLAAVPAVIWYAKAGKGVHVLTVNDYLARRDAQWMGGIYEFFGLSVGYVQSDQLALQVGQQVHRPFAAAVIDEADSILIDEARIPLVIAGGTEDPDTLAYRVDAMTRHFRRGLDYSLDEYGRNISLTDAGIRTTERTFRCDNLFADENLALHTAVQDSLHARALLRRDVDYLVKDGTIVSVDEFKGRTVQDRRWPAGLHSALEAKLGHGVAELGGLYVIGTNRHESRRIDNQLRGRAGRQGDPGSSRFFISLEDDLLVRYGIDNPMFARDPDSIQRVIEGQNLEIRKFLRKYESVIEGQRLALQSKRQDVLTGATPCSSELERLVRLTTIDDLWSEYLAAILDLRSGVHWVSWGGRDPLHEYLTTVHGMFVRLEEQVAEESERRLAEAETGGFDPAQRGATWTYLTTDRPFGTVSERILRGLLRKLKAGAS